MDLLYQLSVEPLKNTLIGYDGRSFGFFVCRNASVMLFEVATVKYHILSPPSTPSERKWLVFKCPYLCNHKCYCVSFCIIIPDVLDKLWRHVRLRSSTHLNVKFFFPWGGGGGGGDVVLHGNTIMATYPFWQLCNIYWINYLLHHEGYKY